MVAAALSSPLEAPASAPLYASVEGHLRAGGWPCQALQGQAFTIVVQGETSRWPCMVVVREEERQVLVYSSAPFFIPEARRGAAMVWLTRANHGLTIGNFELDLDSGEVRYKTSRDVGEADLDRAGFDRMLEINLLTMGPVLPALEALTDAGPAVGG